MSAEPLLWVNGHLVPAREARVDPRDRGFTLGDGLFETMRVVTGAVPWLDQHLTRLRGGTTLMALPLPWSGDQLARAIRETLDANGIGDGVVRLTISRGVPTRRGLLPDPEATPSVVVHAEPFAGYPAALYARGMRAITSRVVRNDRSPLANVKTISALDSVMARREASARGADEAIMRNTAGCLACASAANVFLVTRDTLVTPNDASGILPGTARQRVLGHLASQLALSAIARTVTPDELIAADEAFLTSALLGVMPLTEVDGLPIGTGVPGPITVALGQVMVESWRNDGPALDTPSN
ncbi:MAG: branched-chain amino acid aminotransferase [Thermomicrobiales bacterium]|nr:branched-chain amino acid aminotransferase [Thermomicrobiales bacterium]